MRPQISAGSSVSHGLPPSSADMALAKQWGLPPPRSWLRVASVSRPQSAAWLGVGLSSRPSVNSS